ncbi:hypothetical protein LPB140_01720 [Sphingorhabdus lutea]|uniref:Uncharacterized protein n=1 Tax=Sphingorhabdus lutea TaxID=1913578 RepID=A0A1L3JEA2_9SPHN|nr:hypothetical protein LPB140_01720 [Sphingorhabdus lutea]
MNIEIDCTPEEARTFLGLPDVTKVHEAYVDNISKAMKGATNLDQLEALVKQVAPVGQMGMKLFQQFAENGAAAAFGKKDDKSKK